MLGEDWLDKTLDECPCPLCDNEIMTPAELLRVGEASSKECVRAIFAGIPVDKVLAWQSEVAVSSAYLVARWCIAVRN